MNAGPPAARKPKALRKGSRIAVFAPSSPADALDCSQGMAELIGLGFAVESFGPQSPEGYFAAPTTGRVQDFLQLANDRQAAALIALRGGYGSTYLLSADLQARLTEPKCLVGYSDLTSLQIYLWQCSHWVTFYGPMIAAGLHRGAGVPDGYDQNSFLQSVTNADDGWSLTLDGEILVPGETQGILLGGCLTLLQTSLGTPWELDTRNSILVLEDTGMRPYQVDRALMHLHQAGKFAGVRGILLGEFPGSEPPVPGSEAVRDVCKRLLGSLGIPVLYGAPIGHTKRPLLTLPLGIQARLDASREGKLEILEPAVTD